MLHMAARRLFLQNYGEPLRRFAFFSDISPPAANTIHMNKFIEKHKKLYFYILGAVTGICNGLFGSGGGIAAVPMLQKGGVDVKKSHATSLALTLSLIHI